MVKRHILPWLFGVLTLCAWGQENPSVIAIDEHLGQTIPLETLFRDDSGQPVKLGQLIDKPTLLTLVYFRCPSVCSPLLNGVVDVLDKLDLKPGRDYQVLTISFNPQDTPELAREKKANYLKAFQNPFPAEAWHFLTGDPASIRAITGAMGYQYKRQGDDFLHPVAVMMLSPHGKIIRYLYGMSFLPFDMKLAFLEASQGRVGASSSKILLYCFSYDPEGKTYVFNILKVTGTLVLLILGIFGLILLIAGKRRRKEGEPAR